MTEIIERPASDQAYGNVALTAARPGLLMSLEILWAYAFRLAIDKAANFIQIHVARVDAFQATFWSGRRWWQRVANSASCEKTQFIDTRDLQRNFSCLT